MKTDKEYLVKGSLINGLGLVTRIISPLLILVLARVYSQREFGLFLSFQALMFALSRICLLGLDRGLLWHVPRIPNPDGKTNHGLADSFRLTSLMSLLLFALFALASLGGFLGHFETLQDVSTPFLLMMAGSVWPFAAGQLFSGALEGKRKPQYRVVIALFLTTSLVPAFALLLKGVLGNELSLGAGMLLGNAAGFFLFLPFLRRYFPGEPWLGTSLPPRELLRYSLPLAAAEVANSVLRRLDLWMILLLLGPEKAAVYGVMITITNSLRTIPGMFDSLLIPIVSRMNAEELGAKLRASFSYATNMVSTLQLFIAAFILIFPKEILSLAGKEYAIEIFAFALLLTGNLANGFLGLNGHVMLGMGKSRLILFLTVSALAFNLLCNWIFIPRMGITGAALACSLHLLFQNISHYLYIRVVRKLSLYEPHLYSNAAMELAFIALFFSAYRWIEALSLGMRTAVFAVTILILAGTVFLKRRTYALK